MRRIILSRTCLAVPCIAICGLSGCTVYCHLWPVRLYSVIAICGLSGCTVYCHLRPVRLYSVIAICGLSGCTVYCHLWPVRLYRVLPSVACLAVPFPHYLINGTIFIKNFIGRKMWGLIFFATLSEIFLTLRSSGRYTIINVHLCT